MLTLKCYDAGERCPICYQPFKKGDTIYPLPVLGKDYGSSLSLKGTEVVLDDFPGVMLLHSTCFEAGMTIDYARLLSAIDDARKWFALSGDENDF